MFVSDKKTNNTLSSSPIRSPPSVIQMWPYKEDWTLLCIRNLVW